MTRLRIIFEKTGDMRFIGHLDLLKCMQKSVTRAGIPCAYSKGFNPHQLLGFALPLPLGYAGLNEIAEMELERLTDPNRLISALNGAFPAGLKAKKGIILAENAKSAASIVCGASYSVELPQDFFKLQEAVNAIKSAKEIPVEISSEKKGKQKTSVVNIRDMIFDISCTEKNVVEVIAAAGSEKSVKLDNIMSCLYNLMGEDYLKRKYENTYTRRGLLLKTQV